MVRSRFLGKPPKTRTKRAMVLAGVSKFVDNDFKTAQLISLSLDVFRTTYESNYEEKSQEFKGFNDCSEAAHNLEEKKKEMKEICRQRGIPYEESHQKFSNILQNPNFSSSMTCHNLKNSQVNLPQSLNKSISLDSVEVIYLDDDLNYTYAKSCKGGPLKSNLSSGEVQCGICGIIRFYKIIAKTKKYGAYSCDSCRKFMIRSIENTKLIYRCNNEKGVGQCNIPTGLKSKNKISRVLSIDARCKACWLQMCLKRLKLPETIIERLIDKLPREIVAIVSWALKKPDPWTINIDDNLRKKIIHDYNLHREIINAIHDDSDDNLDEVNNCDSDNIDSSSIKSNSDSEYITKRKCTKNISKVEKIKIIKKKIKRHKKIKLSRDIQSNDVKKIVLSRSTSMSSNSTNETKTITVKGPRIKHVCRSAELALKQAPAVFSNMSELVDDFNEFRNPSIDSLSNQQNEVNGDYLTKDIRNEKLSAIPNNIKCSITGDIYQDTYSSFHVNRTLQDLMMQDQSNANNDNNEDNKAIDLNFRESYDPDRIAENGFAVVSTEPLSVPRLAICYLCGSAGMEKLIHCVTCCEPYHKFCVDGVGIGISSHESEWSKISWTCPKCKLCKQCNSRGKTRPKLTCQRCKDSYHDYCLTDKLTYDRNRPWACPPCRTCKSCHLPKVDYFVGNLALCTECYQLRQHGNYCPLCQQCYDSDDYDSKMMECATCKHWVHSKCEGLSNEKYEVLSVLPDSVEYICKNCTTNSTIPWRSYVDEAFKSGFKSILLSLGKNKKTCDLIKWSPQKQSPGCVCKKTYIPPFPSFDKVTLNDLPKNQIEEPPKQCVCHGLEGWSKGTPTLVSIKQKVNNNEYESLYQFNKDMLNTINKFNAPELKEEYTKIISTVFPWFNGDFLNSSPCKNVYSPSTSTIISPPKFIPKMSFNLLNSDIKALQDMMGNDENSYYISPKIQDKRECQFCKKVGEGLSVREGRLLYCGDNIWAHANCALWSSEVFEEIDGSLQNVQLALSRSKLVRCVVCNEKGASIGCCYRNCVKTYHFQCARKLFCLFNENKTVYCNNHASNVRSSVKDFTLDRLIYIEQEDIKRKKKGSSDVYILIGSLYISCIGHLHPILSDTIESIIPIDFKAKRYYWSTKEPWKLIQYDWTTKVENIVKKLKHDELNYTIDHNQDNIISIEKTIKKDIDYNLYKPMQLNNLDECYETLKKICPIDYSTTKRLKIENFDKYNYSNYETNSEFKSTIDETCKMEKFSNINGFESKPIPQIDGLYDSSDCESEFELCNIKKNSDVIDDCTNDQPVKCERCHRTYRTSLSFERHLISCNFDYGLGSDSDSSEDEKSDIKVEINQFEVENKILYAEPIKEESNLVHQQNYIPITQIPSQQQPLTHSPTLIIQPISSYVQTPATDVQYITINNTQPQSVMPCFQYQTPPTVIVQPSVVDPTTVLLNNPPVDMFMSQSNNLLFSSQPMIVGLDQTYTMASGYTFTQSPQIYQSPKPVEVNTTHVSNQIYILNSEPTSVSNEWSYSITSDIKTEHKVVCTTQPKVYSNRKLKPTECYDSKENIPNRLVQSVENQVYGVMNIINNINPEPWKKQTMRTYPPKRNEFKICSSKTVEKKKILPKTNGFYLNKSTTAINATSVPTKIDNISDIEHNIVSTKPHKVFQHSDVIITNSFTKIENKSIPITNTVKILPERNLEEVISPSCKMNEEIVFTVKEEKKLPFKIEKLKEESLKIIQNCLTSQIEKETSLSDSPPLKKEKLSCNELTITSLNSESQLSLVIHENSSHLFSNDNKQKSLSVEIEKKPHTIANVYSTKFMSIDSAKSSSANNCLIKESLSCLTTVEKSLKKEPINLENVSSNSTKAKVKLLEPVSNPFEKYCLKQSTEALKNKSLPKKQSGRQWSTVMSERERIVPQLMFEMSSADGVFCKDRSLVEIWAKLFDAIQVSRNERKMPSLPNSNPFTSDITAAIRSLGLSNNFLKYLLEQISDAKEFVKYKPTYHKGVDIVGSTGENSSGCARTEIVIRKNRYDMFSWLASRHRKPPKLLANNEDFGGRRANSLPNEMKYRNMNKTLTTTVGVYRSDIHGRGLFCLRDIEQGEYVIEYTGEVIRSEVSDVRERLYNKKGIDCYMFRIDQDTVIDATMNGNSSRFINHSCDPNCQSKIETIHGKKHIMILAKRKVLQGEELTYDYKFPLEDDKITCHCLSRKCRKYLN
ncbi:histone-lysine N-methyltransferase trithorax [Daktulosphaira vitifoliae]|uniref:histone-lysine N-methyltransferase trithorax n=1 Tax=Daktulosphaira vitifoliae TaxID=58002 RepID=UPI0021AA8EB9|nr:histone-lysine N-methyltransferase trithorax [Daktulosphaira vitifoliae]